MSRRLRRTSVVVLVLLAGLGLLGGRSLRIVVERTGGVVPAVPWAAPLGLFLLAAVVGGLAWSTYVALHREKRRMRAERGLRLLALAKAAALVGVVVAGAYAGLALSFTDSLEVELGRERVVRSLVAALAGLVLMAAGLVLERALEIRGDDDEDEGSSGSRRQDGSPA